MKRSKKYVTDANTDARLLSLGCRQTAQLADAQVDFSSASRHQKC